MSGTRIAQLFGVVESQDLSGIGSKAQMRPDCGRSNVKEKLKDVSMSKKKGNPNISVNKLIAYNVTAMKYNALYTLN